ncbi:hypothetical protein KLPMMA068B_26950 [Klebsiella pneumoniae]
MDFPLLAEWTFPSSRNGLFQVPGMDIPHFPKWTFPIWGFFKDLR